MCTTPQYGSLAFAIWLALMHVTQIARAEDAGVEPDASVQVQATESADVGSLSVKAPPTEGAQPTAVDGLEGDLGKLADLSLRQLLDVEIQVNVASLFPETSFEAAATVAAISEADWRRRGARRMTDALGAQPAVVVCPTLWGGRAVAIRGYASSLSTRGIALMLDGMPLNEYNLGTGLYALSNVQLATLERIEMVRGPGSAVHGSDAFHGVLALRSFAPDHNQVEGGAEVGTDLFHHGYGRFSQGLGDEVRLHVALSYSALPDQEQRYQFTQPGTGVPATGERKDAYESLDGSLRVDYDSKSHPVDATVAAYSDLFRAEEALGLGRSVGGASILGDRDLSSVDTDWYAGRARIGVDLDLGLRAETSGYYWRLGGVNEVTAPFRVEDELFRPRRRSFFTSSRGGARLTLQQDGNQNPLQTQWLFGYEFTKAWIGDDSNVILDDPGFPDAIGVDSIRGPDPGAGRSRSVHSAFLSAQTALFGGLLHLHYGGRLDFLSDTDSQVSPRAALVLNPTDRYAVKASYGRAFRAPAPVEQFAPLPLRGDPDLESETIDSVELSLQTRQDRCTGALTGFASFWNNGIIVTPIEAPEPLGPSARYTNLGENRAGGAEATVSCSTHGIRVDSSASYVRSRNMALGLDYSAFADAIFNLGLGYQLAPARTTFYLFQRVELGRTEGAPVPGLESQKDLRPFYQADVNVNVEVVPEVVHLFLNVRNLIARDNKLPSLWNAENGAAATATNASLGVRVMH